MLVFIGDRNRVNQFFAMLQFINYPSKGAIKRKKLLSEYDVS